MATTQIGDLFAQRMAALKQTDQNSNKASNIQLSRQGYSAVPVAEPIAIIIRPKDPSWEELERELQGVTIIAKPLIWITIKKLFEQGRGAELLTAAEIAREVSKKDNPSHLFIKMISKKSGNWERTLKTVYETWNVRRNALTVIEKLKLKADSTKAILKLAWRLKDTIIRFLGIATEQGTGINNPVGLFFALTRKPKPAGA